MTRHTARVSRAGLILTGLILLAGGGAALARSLGAFPAVLGRANVPLLSHAQVRYPTEHAWVWPVTAAAAAVIALIALWWLAAQMRTNTVRRLTLEPDRTHGVTILPADAAVGAITDELESYPGIQRASAALQGAPAAPRLQLSVTAEDHADLAVLRTRIETEALAHLRAALELDTIPTVLRIRFSPAQHRRLA
jgi:hypothetical protein